MNTTLETENKINEMSVEEFSSEFKKNKEWTPVNIDSSVGGVIQLDLLNVSNRNERTIIKSVRVMYNEDEQLTDIWRYCVGQYGNAILNSFLKKKINKLEIL